MYILTFRWSESTNFLRVIPQKRGNKKDEKNLNIKLNSELLRFKLKYYDVTEDSY